MFADGWQGLVREVFGQQRQQDAADQREIGQEVGITTARAVFAHQRVAPPVVTDFHPTPMPANKMQPLERDVLRGERTGKVVTGFGGGKPGLFDRPFAPQHYQGAGEGEICRQGFDGERIEATGFGAAMSGLGVDKKGVAGKASKP